MCVPAQGTDEPTSAATRDRVRTDQSLMGVRPRYSAGNDKVPGQGWFVGLADGETHWDKNELEESPSQERQGDNRPGRTRV